MFIIGQDVDEYEEGNRYSQRRAGKKITATEKSGDKRKRFTSGETYEEEILKDVLDARLATGSRSSFIPSGTASSAPPVHSPEKITRHGTAYSPAGGTKKKKKPAGNKKKSTRKS